MLVSILHRATGVGLATAGVVLFVWWLAAAAGGAESYARFIDWVTYNAPPPPPGAPVVAGAHGGITWFWALVLIGLTWAFLQHLANGVRHLFMDLGANFELRANKTSAVATIAFSAALTVLLWAWILTR